MPINRNGETMKSINLVIVIAIKNCAKYSIPHAMIAVIPITSKIPDTIIISDTLTSSKPDRKRINSKQKSIPNTIEMIRFMMNNYAFYNISNICFYSSVLLA